MARFSTNLSVTTPNEVVTALKSGDYDVALKVNAELDDSDAFINLVAAGKDVGQNTLRGCKALLIRNSGLVGVELSFKTEEWADAAPDTNGSPSYQSYLIR